MNIQSAPRIPNSEKYWIKKGKNGKNVMVYTHDDMDGIFSAIAIKKYLLDKGFNIVGYGIVNYQDSWDVIKIDKSLINVAVDFADAHEDIDIYIDHHGEFIDGDKMDDRVRKMGAIKTQTGSAYEGIMQQLGLPTDSLILDVIDMIDSAKYDEYGVKWTELLDFDINFIKTKPNSKLLFAGAFNQMLKRGDYQTIIEVIHNVDEPSIFKIFDYMKKLYPGNNLILPRGANVDDYDDYTISKFKGKDFVEDGTWRLNQVKKRTSGSAEVKNILNSQKDFIFNHKKIVSYDVTSRSRFAGEEAEIVELDGYCVIGELVFVGSGTWANPIRARSIIQRDIESGRLPINESQIKWVLLQYGDTLQVCSYNKIEDYDEEELPKSKSGKPINDLKIFCTNILNNFKNKLNFTNPYTKAGGHKGIGTISNIGVARFIKSPNDDKEYYFIGLKYLDLMKNYIISSLSKVSWRLDLSWENPFSIDYAEEPVPVDARTMKINQIRKINKKTGKIELPEFYERKPSMKTMKANAIIEKEMEEKEMEEKIKKGVEKAKAKHDFYRKDRGNIGFEQWIKLKSKGESENTEITNPIVEVKKIIEVEKPKIEVKVERPKVEKQKIVEIESPKLEKPKTVKQTVKNSRIKTDKPKKEKKKIEPKKTKNIKVEKEKIDFKLTKETKKYIGLINKVFSFRKKLRIGLTEVSIKNNELTILHKSNDINNINSNLKLVGLPNMNQLKKNLNLKIEEDLSNSYKIIFKI